MKRILYKLVLIFFILSAIFITVVSTLGIETKKFNNLITYKINQTNNNLDLKLSSIKFKIDIKELSLFLETNNPIINYRNIPIPAKNIKVYLDFISLIKTETQIKKINLVLNRIEVNQLKEISNTFKPSNLTSFIKNKILEGKLNTEIEFFLDKNNLFENFIARGSFTNLKAKTVDNLILTKTNFDFIADKSDILVKNIFGEISFLKIIDGDLKIEFLPEVEINANFTTDIKFNGKEKKDLNLLNKFSNLDNLTNLEGSFNNSFFVIFDKTYKVKDYSITNNGKISNLSFYNKEFINNEFLSEKINLVSVSKAEVKSEFTPKQTKINIDGSYSTNKGIFLDFNLENIKINKNTKVILSADFDKFLKLEAINFENPKNTIGKINLEFEKFNENLLVNKLSFIQGDNEIFFKDLKLKNNKFLSLKKAKFKTKKNMKVNNDFEINFGDKILIKGNQFDATNLPKFLNEKSKDNPFSNLNKEIEIDFKKMDVPLSEKLENFKLLGKIERGKFIKISSKGSFGGNNFLDITMKHDKNYQKQYLEVYSDLTRPLLTEFSFFKGLTGGKLLYSSIIEDKKSSSKLLIENFKVINAPGMVKLLSLADLGGLADLAAGEGLTFDLLEIKMEKTKNNLKLNEILALGPSISILMEGYQNSELTSLRGTLVPAKTLNKMISKIPVIGDIVIPKEIGEGLFGISFKMKGPPGKIKTTINPIRTITPRFIQKIIDKKKNSK
tara:strand:- start:1463 stop:3646 length:2184 start_codon:yes stop_codon:yes gene_type:complete